MRTAVGLCDLSEVKLGKGRLISHKLDEISSYRSLFCHLEAQNSVKNESKLRWNCRPLKNHVIDIVLCKLLKPRGLRTKIMLDFDGNPEMGAPSGSSEAAKRDFLHQIVAYTPGPIKYFSVSAISAWKKIVTIM